MRTKYDILVKVLDDLCAEAPESYKAYHPTRLEEVPKARGLAYIHLLLKARFGLRTFAERDELITDGGDDGGVDAYYISHEQHVVYFIQSKFRNTECNFDGGTDISVEDLASMQLREIITPRETDDVSFNGRVQGLQRKLSELRNPQLYEYKVIILANLKDCGKKKTKEAISRLLMGFEFEVVDYRKTYDELLLPSLSGTCSQPKEVVVPLTLRGKNDPQATNTITTAGGDCTMSIMFVPTVEVAKMMHDYRNALLTYNPRSFLGLRKGTINDTIRRTVVNSRTNEFALFNNGLTIVTSGSDFYKKLGTTDSGVLTLKDPQIINGGQTAATLAQIYEDDGERKKLDGKEVIRQLSEATNGQTAITDADRQANDPLLETFKKHIFADFGMLYEHKSGEFYEGLEHDYVKRNQFVKRDDFLRVSIAMNGDPGMARSGGKAMLYSQHFFKDEQGMSERQQVEAARKYMYGYFVLCHLKGLKPAQYPADRYGNVLRYGRYAAVFLCARFRPDGLAVEMIEETATQLCDKVLSHWKEFEGKVMVKRGSEPNFDFDNYYKTQAVAEDLKSIQLNWLDE